jgi:hypothetical protein
VGSYDDGLGRQEHPEAVSHPAKRTRAPARYLWYFQLRDLPSAIHSTACFTRAAVVSSRFASAIHSLYSR